MSLFSLKRIIYSSWKSFFKNNGFSVATIFILVFTLILVPSFFLFHQLSQFLISSVQEKADVSVYFVPDLSPEEILEIQEELKGLPEVKSVEYTSREEALEEFTQRYKEDQEIIEGLEEYGGNPLFASLNIKAFEAAQYTAIQSFLESNSLGELIDHTSYSKSRPVIDKIFFLTSYINKFGIALIIILSAIAILVVFNHIRLAIVNSKEEISVMRLVGATNWFIRGPFMVQGIIAGIFAALIAALIFGLASFFLAPTAEILVADFNIFEQFVANFWVILSIQLIVGIGLGAISSTLAIRKYLKV